MSLRAGERLRDGRTVRGLADEHRRELVRLADHALALRVDLAGRDEQLGVGVRRPVDDRRCVGRRAEVREPSRNLVQPRPVLRDAGRFPAEMFGKLHITVDRKKLKSRYTSVKRSMEAIDEGKNLIIFPEGGIVTEKGPVMGPFKDGAFRIAVEKQIPIVPVTIPYNWIILPPDEFLLRWHPLKVIFHQPVETAGLTAKDIDTLKQQVFTIIEQELKQHLKNEN